MVASVIVRVNASGETPSLSASASFGAMWNSLRSASDEVRIFETSLMPFISRASSAANLASVAPSGPVKMRATGRAP